MLTIVQGPDVCQSFVNRVPPGGSVIRANRGPRGLQFVKTYVLVTRINILFGQNYARKPLRCVLVF